MTDQRASANNAAVSIRTPAEIAYRLSDMIRVTRYAFTNENECHPLNDRGIGGMLEEADEMAGELIERIHQLEAKIPTFSAEDAA
ncbi:hypothetical protein [Tropicimonas isoalkanivorans]|uniref:Uncharacterized protein n=1 Tax=Tropicimonas isoalkanivorans TaxID=441112 RepID=A0A1I1E4F4_9RHOB|nr:hypothetical protein [Tropicimonas isoalkanivorans]SFB82119.1 hypothetical protein SAMN04488094_101637 [Tropicimonas isoalkanivorans]